LCIAGPAISRRQFRVLAHEGRYEIEDLGSTNGTWVGDVRLRERTRLRPGMRIRVGNMVFRFALQDEIEREGSTLLYEMSVRDALTGTFNRRHFEERLGTEIAFAARQQSPLSLLLVDVDTLKPVNDHFGHAAGDAVLNAVGSVLRKATREEDLVARIGGDEFAVLVCADGEGARVLGERLRACVEALQVPFSGAPLPATVSIGIASFGAAATTRDIDLMAAADVALYAAKRAGRNRIEYTPASPSTEPEGAATNDEDSRRPTRAED
jgi:diguanylate cyclase (GGDEF)-like protein